MPPISATIIAKNEAERIADAIKPLQGLVDDILVVDSGSTDETCAIAEQMGARVIENAWIGYGPQKRFAEDEALHDWVLNLDADEVLTDEAVGEIRVLKDGPEPRYPGYRIRTVNVYPGAVRPRLFADFHNYIRLYDKRVMRFPDSLTHDAVTVPASIKVGQIKAPCLHYSIVSLEQLAAKLDRYTDLQAVELKKNRVSVIARLPFEYGAQFLKQYIGRRHFTGGLFGMKVAHTVAASKVQRLLKFLRAGTLAAADKR